jgi:hypothetical protein
MAGESEPSRILAAAAKLALLPIGCQREGRSRLWIADEKLWVAVIEFQPSGFGKGSYLNVGAHRLWYAKDYWSFDYGNRIEDFAPFQSAAQFSPLAEKLAAQAAQEVQDLRTRFHSIAAIANLLVAREANLKAPYWWDAYHAAVAVGLAGDTARSRQLFRLIAGWSPTFDRDRDIQAHSARLESHVDDLNEFRSVVLGVINEARVLHRLGPNEMGAISWSKG